MSTLHLHIGSQKTGTTSIQKTFFENREVLQRQGFLYPGNQQNGHLFYFATNAQRKDWPRQFKSRKKEGLEEWVKEYFSTLKKGFSTGIDQQIISTEYLFISNINYIRNVISFLEEYFDRMKVYLFIRSPEEYYRSLQQQIIKARSYITSPANFKYSFKNVAKAWHKVADLQVIPYRSGINSCKILCNKMGVNYDKLTLPKRSSNTSIAFEQMRLLEKIQQHLYQDYDDIFKDHLGVIHNISAPFLNKPQLQEWVKSVIYQNHLSDLQWLKAEHGIDFLNEELENKEIDSTPSFENGKATVRDIYKVPSEEAVEKYEALVIDALLKKLVQNK